jgi:Restriction endonuclease S subunits
LPGKQKRKYKNDLLFSEIRPANKDMHLIDFEPNNYVVSTKLMVLRCTNMIDNIFFKLFITSKEQLDYLQMIAEDRSGTFPQITFEQLADLDFPLPPLPEQKAIAEVLSSIDDKIELLHRQNKTLEEMAMTLFRQWFIEPTKDGLPDGWEEVSLGEFFPVITGKKDANFATDNGLYPFFTCSQKPLKAPSYSFDGNAILLAGNGDFNIKRYRGKFEAYQRTYVLIPYNPEYFNFLYSLMKFYLDDITVSYKGSVINYITKDMIEDFKFSLPKDRTSIIDKLLYFDSIYEKVDANTSQIQTLEKLRDTLLPKLMSGEIRVKI